jgi:hypothetical protein
MPEMNSKQTTRTRDHGGSTIRIFQSGSSLSPVVLGKGIRSPQPLRVLTQKDSGAFDSSPIPRLELKDGKMARTAILHHLSAKIQIRQKEKLYGTTKRSVQRGKRSDDAVHEAREDNGSEQWRNYTQTLHFKASNWNPRRMGGEREKRP